MDDVQSYSAANRELDIYPRQTETNAQQASLTIQLENLEKRLLVSLFTSMFVFVDENLIGLI